MQRHLRIDQLADKPRIVLAVGLFGKNLLAVIDPKVVTGTQVVRSFIGCQCVVQPAPSFNADLKPGLL